MIFKKMKERYSENRWTDRDRTERAREENKFKATKTERQRKTIQLTFFIVKKM